MPNSGNPAAAIPPSDPFPTPIVRLHAGETISQTGGEAVAEHPHKRHVEIDGALPMPDTSGITVKSKLADIVRLVLQAGFAVVAFAAVIGGGIWAAAAIRSDYKARDAETRADHKEEVQKLLTTFTEQQKLVREDIQEREKRHEANNERMWRRLGEVADTQREAVGVMKGVAADLKTTADEFRKIANKMP